MNKLIVLVALLAFSAFGATNDVKYASLIYWTDTITYAPDVHLKALRELLEKEIMEKQEGWDENESNLKSSANTVDAGTKTKVDGDVTFTNRGAPTAKVNVHAEAFAETRFTWEKKRIFKTQSLQKALMSKVAQTNDEISIMKSDWKLRFNINFRNESKEQAFEYKEGGYTGVFLVIKDKDNLKKEAPRIPISPDNLKPDSFVLRPNGGKATLTVEADIPNQDIREVLLAANVSGVLDQYVMIEFDDQFNMEAKDANSLWNYQDVCASKVAIMGFGAWSPEVVNSGGLTYRGVLDRASRLAFDYADDDALNMVGKRYFGRVASDDKGVYVILAKIRGEFKDRLSKEELGYRLSAKDYDKDLIFVRLGLQDIYANYTQCPVSVVSNCYSYVRDSRDVSDEDLFACAILAKEGGDYSLFGYCLSRIKNLDGFLKDEVNKSLAMSLIIKSDNVEYFEKLQSLEWVCADRTILGFAAENGSANIVKWLLEKAPDNERLKNGKLKVDDLVAGADDDDVGYRGKTPLYWAAKNGHLKVCQYLASKGADVNRVFYEKEKKSGKVREYDELVKLSYISDACITNYINAQREVLKFRNMWRPREGAFKEGITADKIKSWVCAGVLPDSPNCDLGYNWNFLSWAIFLKDVSLVDFLIDHGADVNSATPDDNFTALMLACEAGDTNLVAKLIAKSVDVYAQQDDGMTAFHHAIRCQKYDCAKMLLEYLDIAKCDKVEVDGIELNLVQYVGIFCDDDRICSKVKGMNPQSWLEMLKFWHEKGFSDCLTRCKLGDDEIIKLSSISHTVQMADDLYDKGLLHSYLERIRKEGLRHTLEATDPTWTDWFDFIELREKAENGDKKSQCELGRCYGNGNGVSKNADKAFRWFHEAAMGEWPEALYHLGTCYNYGFGTAKDKLKAKECREKAEKLGYKR